MTFAQILTNTTTTHNGDLTNKSTLSPVVDLFSMGVSSSNLSSLILKALHQDPAIATKVVFYLRDARGGQGNRKILRTYFDLLVSHQYAPLYPVIYYVPAVGYWKDVYSLYGLSKYLDPIILTLVHKTLTESDDSTRRLAAKWFPRQSQFHHDYATFTGTSIGDVRRLVASLSDTVEQRMCSQQWSEINYSAVPSLANRRYANCFLARDHDRRAAFLTAVRGGAATINASVLYPHDITSMLIKGQDVATVDALWQNLPNYIPANNAHNVLPIIDLSGSMEDSAGGTSLRCMDIAIGLGLYVAEHNTGAFKDLWCTFSSNPTFEMLKGDTFSERVRNLDYDNWGGSTDLVAVFERMLSLNVPAEEMPSIVLIVSDMHFNTGVRNQSTLSEIRDLYKRAGYELPIVVFWRVDKGIDIVSPVTFNEEGILIVNGYSPSILQLILSLDLVTLKATTAETLMLEAIKKYSYLDPLLPPQGTTYDTNGNH